MTDAPKIDTQAPDTSREAVSRHIDDLWEMLPASWARQTENLFAALLAERDLADARAAAAVLDDRQQAYERLNSFDTGKSSGDDLHYNLAVLRCRDAFRDMPLPDPAALDRLIAERVREAVEADIRGAITAALDGVHIEDGSLAAFNSTVDCIVNAIAARGSKEGRDG